MQWSDAVGWRRGALRVGLISGSVALSFVLIHGVNPHTAHASPLQYHGALQREDGDIGVIAHRGAAASAPENTLAAMELAIEQGVDFVETDVRLTADGVAVLIHDARLERTTNGRGAVADLTLDEIRAFDAGRWFDADFAEEPVPTLEEYIELLSPGATRTLLELKGVWAPEEIGPVVELLREHRMVNRVALQSFEPETLDALIMEAPEFARVLLTREFGDEVIESAIELRVSAIGARAKLYDETPENAARIRDLGIGALVYTLNSEDKWVEAIERGNDLIITDDPVSLEAWRDSVR